MRIKTTHVGSLPRPDEMNAKNLKKQVITDSDLKSYLTHIIERQLSLNLTYINNGELPRSDYVNATVSRISGFFEKGIAPIPKDLEDLPEYSRRFGGRNGLITLNPKAPVTLPACSDELSYVGENTLRNELKMMMDVFDEVKEKKQANTSSLFFTSPSPGTVALFLDNKYYSNYETYLNKLSDILKKEYEIIASYGIHLQIDCPDIAMGRHTKFKALSDAEFNKINHLNVNALNHALSGINEAQVRSHVCWGNYPGTHHCDITLDKIIESVMAINARYISLESCNSRHAHEWELFKTYPIPDDKVLMPGVIETTSNCVEHPELVAQRLLNYAQILGPERVIGSTDCGFASTASATSVSGEVAWLKLKSLVDGAKIASEKFK